MPNRYRRGILAWDPCILAWDPKSHAESHADVLSAWDPKIGAGFGVGFQNRRGIRRGISQSAWNSAWDFAIGVGGENPMRKFGVEDPLGGRDRRAGRADRPTDRPTHPPAD